MELLENVPETDFNGYRADAQESSYLFGATALGDPGEHFSFPGRKDFG